MYKDKLRLNNVLRLLIKLEIEDEREIFSDPIAEENMMCLIWMGEIIVDGRDFGAWAKLKMVARENRLYSKWLDNNWIGGWKSRVSLLGIAESELDLS